MRSAYPRGQSGHPWAGQQLTHPTGARPHRGISSGQGEPLGRARLTPHLLDSGLGGSRLQLGTMGDSSRFGVGVSTSPAGGGRAGVFGRPWRPAAHRAGLRAPPAANGGEGGIALWGRAPASPGHMLRAQGALTWLSRTRRTLRLFADQLQPGHLRTGQSRDTTVAGTWSRFPLGAQGRGLCSVAWPRGQHRGPRAWPVLLPRGRGRVPASATGSSLTVPP